MPNPTTFVGGLSKKTLDSREGGFTLVLKEPGGVAGRIRDVSGKATHKIYISKLGAAYK